MRPQPPRYEGKNIVKPFIKEAERRGLKVHAWIVALNFPNNKFIEAHKDWYVVNKLGLSCLDKPPYVPNYKWLCPSKSEVAESVADFFLEVASTFNLDGVHFDYIRLPDIILPKALRSLYPEAPKEEVLKPELGYCYCQTCRSRFKAKEGLDPADIGYEDPSYHAFHHWRTEQITNLVKKVYRRVKGYDQSLEVSAAVFPTPTIAYKRVFQNWPQWSLDLYDPMIYHRHYDKPSTWIGEAVEEGVSKGVKLSAGILIDFMESLKETVQAFQSAVRKGALGITVFVYPLARAELKGWIKEAFKKAENL